MATGKMNARVDAFIRNAKKWRDEFEALRTIILDCRLREEMKWGLAVRTRAKTSY
jgi:uncharacterized protein YdeI (YjbR/CyaY-like superfamily)